MTTSSQKIIFTLEMLSGSLTDADEIRRVQKWISEQKEAAQLPVKSNGKERKQVLVDTRRTLLHAAKQIESSLTNG